MTLSRLFELYNAQKEGKTIMMHTHHSRYYSSSDYDEKVNIMEIELSDLVNDNVDVGDSDEYERSNFYIDGEEDIYGSKLSNEDDSDE